ncbi:glycosyltransferase family 39 protein [Moorena sp. SIO3I6]|uniref:glycosyltransferase family 39 protein n=1 Tax=Moorena sp. SIO3I6 TaxID=2607831 RepID=UPI0025E74190|nr:glycosyltransferase family 39 protein [Moorena sp. SIO3I6]
MLKIEITKLNYSRFPTPDSLLPIPDSRFPIPDSRLPVTYSLLPTPYSLSFMYLKKSQTVLLLLLWITIGALLRFAGLGVLPPWTDECATTVFSLGNSFYSLPLNQFMGVETLLSPLKPSPEAGISDVIHYLLTESTHPPVYFALTHLWLKLFRLEDGMVSIWAVRSLSALLGVISIPAIFCLGRLAFRSLLVGHIAAAMMAVSPFGIFLAQQARHYTLAILLVIASLGCLVKAVELIDRGERLPSWLGLAWVGVNSLGIATHYFFILTLGAEAIALFGQAWRETQQDRLALIKPYWWRIYGVAMGSLAGCLVWIPALQAIHDSPPTQWIYSQNAIARWIEPIGRFLLWLFSMVLLLPSSFYDLSLGIIIVSGIVTLILVIWIVSRLRYGLKLQQLDHHNRFAITILREYVLAAIGLCLVLTWGFGIDLSTAPRFHFVYFPAVILLVAASLGGCWNQIRLVAVFKGSPLTPLIKGGKEYGSLSQRQTELGSPLTPLIKGGKEYGSLSQRQTELGSPLTPLIKGGKDLNKGGKEEGVGSREQGAGSREQGNGTKSDVPDRDDKGYTANSAPLTPQARDCSLGGEIESKSPAPLTPQFWGELADASLFDRWGFRGLAAKGSEVNSSEKGYKSYFGKRIVVAVWLIGLLGGLVTVSNLGYLQNERPDLLVSIVKEASEAPVAIATTYKHHGQTGRMMGLAWGLKGMAVANGSNGNSKDFPQFFLVDRDRNSSSYEDSVKQLQQKLMELPRPLDLWLVNFRTKIDLDSQQCFREKRSRKWAGQYSYKLYRCVGES